MRQPSWPWKPFAALVGLFMFFMAMTVWSGMKANEARRTGPCKTKVLDAIWQASCPNDDHTLEVQQGVVVCTCPGDQ